MTAAATLLERLIGRLKGQPKYRFESGYTSGELRRIVYYRSLQVVRGLLHRPWLHMSGGLLLAGRGVLIEHGGLVHAGPHLILEDHVFINALSERGVVFGRNCTVGRDTVIMCTGVVRRKGVGLRLGDHSAIGPQSFLGAQGGIAIGSDVIMGPGVRIFSENHEFADVTVPIRAQGERREAVMIEDDCWIGAGVTILDGVTIGRGTVVAAGAVVTHSLPPYSVVAGVPARALKNRRGISGKKAP